MERQNYTTTNETAQRILDGFSGENSIAEIDREISLCRALIQSAYQAGDRASAVQLLGVLARLAKEHDRQAIRSEQMMSKTQCEALINDFLKLISKHFAGVPGFSERMQSLGNEILAALGDSRPTEFQKRAMLRLTDARPGSKTGVTE